MVGDPSSKYAYGRSLDKDIKDKCGKVAELELELYELISKEIRYLDGSIMSIDQKVECLRNVFKRINV